MAARRTIIDTDPPEHTKLRKIVASTFSQRAVAVYEHFITGLTEDMLDRMPASGVFDFVDTVAKEVPIPTRWSGGAAPPTSCAGPPPPRRIRSNFTNELMALPVRVTP